MPPLIRLFILFALATMPKHVNSAEFALNFNTHVSQTEKLMPLGATSFIEMISKSLFIDKTLFLSAILKKSAVVTNLTQLSLREETNYLIIVCPHNWGKTMNLDMLKTFLEIQVHPNGSRIFPLVDTPNYQLFVHGKYHTNDIHITLEKPLLISDQKYRPLVGQYLGQYPVIHLTFASVSPTVEENCTTILGKLFADLFHQHKYMLVVYDHIIQDQGKTNDEKRDAENAKTEFLSYLQNIPREDLHSGLRFLSEQLNVHFGKKIFLLVDEYERIFHMKGLNLCANFLTKTLQSYGSSYDPVKTIFLTGVVPQSYDTQTVMLRKFSRIPFPYYGFVREEMKLLYEHYRIPVDEQKRIKYWYGGFNTMKSAAYETYNPYSVCNYMNSRLLKPYWKDERDHMRNLISILESTDFLNVFIKLIVGKYYETEHSSSEREWKEFNLANVKQALTYLNAAGYLIVKSPPVLAQDNEKQAHVARYRIPNYEISLKLQTIFDESFEPLKSSNNTATKWEKFLLGKSLVSLLLENEILKYFKYLEYPQSKESLVRVAIRLTAASKKLHFINWRFISDADNETVTPDMILSSNTRGIVVDISHGETVRSGIPLISRYVGMLERYPQIHGWQDMKLVFLNLIPDKELRITSLILPINLTRPQRPTRRPKTTINYTRTTLPVNSSKPQRRTRRPKTTSTSTSV